MRTAILLGLTAIADAINKDWGRGPHSIVILAWITIIMLLMDVAEFLKKMNQ